MLLQAVAQPQGKTYINHECFRLGRLWLKSCSYRIDNVRFTLLGAGWSFTLMCPRGMLVIVCNTVLCSRSNRLISTDENCYKVQYCTTISHSISLIQSGLSTVDNVIGFDCTTITWPSGSKTRISPCNTQLRLDSRWSESLMLVWCLQSHANSCQVPSRFGSQTQTGRAILHQSLVAVSLASIRSSCYTTNKACRSAGGWLWVVYHIVYIRHLHAAIYGDGIHVSHHCIQEKRLLLFLAVAKSTDYTQLA